MAEPTRRHAVHQIKIAAPADAVYRLVAGVENWPWIFPPTVHVELLERDETSERLRIWATANDEVKNWTSRRELDPVARRIEFRQEVSRPPVAAMGGTWVIEELSEAECEVRLEHDYVPIDDDPATEEWIRRALDRNSDAELDALREAAELRDERAGLTLSFEDSVRVDGAAADVYDFLYQAGLWEQRLPHVARVELVEDTPDIQSLEMDTRGADGSTHTTRSIRVCFPRERIVYKQLVLPPLLKVHIGHWRVSETADGVTVTSGHTVVLRPEAIPTVLGPDVTMPQAGEFVRKALSNNSSATLNLAKEFAEARR